MSGRIRRSPMPEEFTPEELAKRDQVLDRIRGGPKQRLQDLAQVCEMSYEQLMEKLDGLVDGTGDGIHLGFDTPDYDSAQVWADYELITKKVVSQDAKDSWLISCAC